MKRYTKQERELTLSVSELLEVSLGPESAVMCLPSFLFPPVVPRNPDYAPHCSPGWRLRLAASVLLAVFPLLDLLPVILPPGAGPGPTGLEVLAGGVAAVAWVSHSLHFTTLTPRPPGLCPV